MEEKNNLNIEKLEQKILSQNNLEDYNDINNFEEDEEFSDSNKETTSSKIKDKSKKKPNIKDDTKDNNEKWKLYLIQFGKILLNKLYHLCIGIIAILIVLGLFIGFLNWSNDNLVITEDFYIDNNLPGSFDGYKILQISDFNNKKDLSKTLINKTKEIKPDIIVITGDYINSDRCTEFNIDYSYLEEIAKTYSVYFVPGEQEQDSVFYEKMKTKLETMNVKVLENEVVELKKGTDSIQLMGIYDSSFFFENITMLNNKIKENRKEGFTILLSHRPELIDVYTENNINLVLSGHALGGQIRFPYVGAFYSSNQGFYPDYTNGFYKQENTTVYVSRGIGNTFIPVRIFNRPEINVIVLKNK